MSVAEGQPATGESASLLRRFNVRGCLLRVLIVVAVLTAIVVAIGEIFDQGDSADQPVRGFDAGPAANFQPASVVQFEQQHVFVVRMQDGEFLAFYDKSTKQQELGGDCRLQWDDTALIGTLEPVPGITGGFVEDCDDVRSVWRADGAFAFGGSWGDLDRYNTSVNADGDLIVDTRTRTCTRSAGVPGQEPFEQRECGTGT
jgi:hypothetical protein